MNLNPNAMQGPVTSGKNISYWLDSGALLSFAKLDRDVTTDVVIVGGGIAGLTTAYLLLKAGKKVTLIEDGNLGSGESGRTTAHLTCALDDRYYFLENTFGEKNTRLAAQSHIAAIDQIEKIVNDEQIDCSFKRVSGYLFTHPSDDEKNLDKEYAATQKAGIQTVLQDHIPAMVNADYTRSLVFPGQAQFHILKYLTGLATAIRKLGGVIYTQTRAEKIDKHGVTANGHTVSASAIVVATNTPINDLFTMHTKQYPYRTYVVAGKVKKGLLPYALWWDTSNVDSKWVSQPYHYVRLEEFDEEYDLLISGGEDHKTGQADNEDIPETERYQKLESWTRSRFPQLGEIVYHWSGQVMEPVDSLGYMGKNPGDDNIYIITGDSGNGMTHTTIGAMIIRDALLGIKNDWEALYSPSRITLKTTGDFLREATNMAAQYLDWVSPSELKHAEDLPAGQGGILNSGMKKIAVYRDQTGKLAAFSAVCPHLGCIVRWNADEQSFDCPCHGSRFSCTGTLMNGPAVTNLEKVELPAGQANPK